MSLAAAAKRLDALAAKVVPPPALPSRLELFRLADGEPDPWQADALASAARQLMLNVTRQGGKSTVAAVLGLDAALSAAASLVLVLSPGERQSKLLFKRIVRLYRALGEPVPAETDNRLALELANGSEVHALPGTEATVRGFSAAALLIVDEASRVPDALYQAVRPMLAVSGGRLVTLSTPWGKRGWWYEAWVSGGDAWERYEVPATACPRISEAFLAEERRALPPLVYAAEYACAFVDTESQVFATDLVRGALSPAVRPLFPLAGAA